MADISTGNTYVDPLDPNIDPATGLPYVNFSKAPGGGITYPTYTDPGTGALIPGAPTTDPSGAYVPPPSTSLTGSYDPAQNGTYTPQPGDPGYTGVEIPLPSTLPPPPTTTAPHPDTTTSPDTGSFTPASGGGPGTEIPLPPTPPPVPSVPQAPEPSDITGYAPSARSAPGSDARSIVSENRTALTRLPGNASGFRSGPPAWARGVMSSPFARFAMRGGQAALAGMRGFTPDTMPTASAQNPFAPDVPVDPTMFDQRRFQQDVTVPAWLRNQ